MNISFNKDNMSFQLNNRENGKFYVDICCDYVYHLRQERGEIYLKLL